MQSPIRQNSRALIFVVFVGYFVVWLIPRYEPIMENALFYDDYLRVSEGRATEANPCRFPAKDYRWVYDGILCGLEKVAPNFMLSRAPKLLSGVGISLFCVGLFCIFRRWRTPTLLAGSIPLIILCHPILNDITLWNIAGFFPLWLAFCSAAFLILGQSAGFASKSLAVFILSVVLFAYELYLITFLVLVFCEPFFCQATGARVSLSDSVKKAAIFVALGIVYILHRLVIEAWVGEQNIVSRDIVNFLSWDVFLREKLQATTNLLSNVYATPLSFYQPLLQSLSAWKWIPIVLSVGVGAITLLVDRSIFKAFAAGLFAVLAILLPSSPILLTDQNPSAWRIAVPILISSSIVLLFFQVQVSRFLSEIINKRILKNSVIPIITALNVLLAGSLVLPAYYEAQLRATEFKLESNFINDIKSSSPFAPPHKMTVIIEAGGKLRADYALSNKAALLNSAYQYRGFQTSLTKPFSWRGKLVLHGIEPVELATLSNSKYREQIQSACTSRNCFFELGDVALDTCRTQPDIVETKIGLQAAYLVEQKISVICVRPSS